MEETDSVAIAGTDDVRDPDPGRLYIAVLWVVVGIVWLLALPGHLWRRGHHH